MAVILDTNLLVLFVVGTASKDYIRVHKRLNAYTVDDFDLLLKILSSAAEVLVTPNTLSETSNLIGYIGDPARTHIREIFRLIVCRQETEESYVNSKLAVQQAEFVRLGLADVTLLEVTSDSHMLLTADLDLYIAAVSRGLKAENFNHYRDL